MVCYAVIDLSNLFYRSRFGARGDAEMKVAMALQILFRTLRKIHRELAVDHMVFAADQGSWRYSVYPNYKSRRRREQFNAAPAEKDENRLFSDALASLIAFLRDGTRCTVLCSDSIEGDDFVAGWIGRHPDDSHIIVSGDSDFVQLLAPNVRIYDAINQRIIDIWQIVDGEQRKLQFSVDPKNGKIKVGDPAPDFVAEDDWWHKALFVKIVRGDLTNSIFSAFPKVRYDGKKTGISAAWEDRRSQGYDWNNFMFQTWDRLVGTAKDGTVLTESVRVIDAFRLNETLIDLYKQPDWIKSQMNVVIDQAIACDLPKQIGVYFLRFCQKYDLPSLAKEANDHMRYLNSGYPGR